MASSVLRTKAAPGATWSGTGDMHAIASAVWCDGSVPLHDGSWREVLGWASANRVRGLVVRRAVHPDPAEVASLDAARSAFVDGLVEVAARLHDAGVAPLLVKTDLDRDFEYSNVDVVVGDDGWDAARTALRGWGREERRYRLERTKVIVHPPTGTPIHLHRTMSWFDIPLFDTDALRRNAHPSEVAHLLVPDPADELRTLLAHALFQNLTLDLADLLRLRETGTPATRATAASRAATEGWADGFAAVLATVDEVMHALDAGRPVSLPAPLGVSVALRGGLEHARHLLRRGRGAASLREVGLRGPLVWRKLVRPAR